MTVVRGIIREVGRSRTTRVSAQRWYGTTDIVVQNEESGKTYLVKLSATTMQRHRFLPRVGMDVILHGFVEEAEYGLSDYVVTRVNSIKHVGSEPKKTHKFD
ncbi:MAG: hypothetical protein ACP6KW_11060 [Candidatus Thorarchaeota archaeon]